jgi:hypothetical protein
MIDPLTQKYLEVLNEGTDKGIVKTNLKTGNPAFEGDLNKGSNDPTENVDLDKPEEDKNNSGDKKDGKMEKCSKNMKQINSSTELNPFESLYNKIISEKDSFGWSMDEDDDEGTGEVDDFEVSDEEESSESDDMDFGDEDESSEGEEVTFTLDKETAQKLIDVLQAAVGGSDESESDEDIFDDEESSEDEGEDFDFEDNMEDSDEDEDEELTKEEVDAEIVGHSLVDQEKLLKGMNKPSNGVVRNKNISAKKKKANVPLTGKGFKGQLNKHKESAGKSLQGKNNKVSAVNVGKTIIDNK